MGKTREADYPKVGDEVQLVIGTKDDVQTLAFYKVVEGEGTGKLLLQFLDVRLVKESEIPI